MDSTPRVGVTMLGRLGNNLFQIASAYSYAKQHNANFYIIDNNGRTTYWDSILADFKQYIVPSLPEHIIHWGESSATEYCHIPNVGNKGLHLGGYLQSPKYFHQIKSELLQRMRSSPDEGLLNKYKCLFDNLENVVIVHARRTDYVAKKQYHGLLSQDYYQHAIELMKTKIQSPIFLLCSDDINYWSNVRIPALTGQQCHILDENEINTFILLQQFKHFIIANSTFSWWAAWLAEPTVVIAPQQWFGPTGPQNYNDIYENDWIRIESGFGENINEIEGLNTIF